MASNQSTRTNKQEHTQRIHNFYALALVITFAVAGLIALTVARAATQKVSVSNFFTSTAIEKSDPNVNGTYLEFNNTNSYGAPALGPVTPEPFAADPYPELVAGELPEYPKPPAANGTTIRKVNNYDDWMKFARDDSVAIIVMADGNYQGFDTVKNQERRVLFDGFTDKVFWAENKYGAVLKPQADYGGNVNLAIANSRHLTFRGFSFEKANNYALRIGGEGAGIQGYNEDITIEHSRIKDPAQSGIGINNGYGSGWKKGCPIAESSKRILIQYNEITNLGSNFDRPEFTEGIYTTSGGSCQQADQVEDVVIRGNIFTQTNPSANQGGEAIGCKSYTRNLFIEKNHITNMRIAQSTDGGAISVWEEQGIDSSDSGDKGIVIRGNYIDGVRTVPGTSSAKANGISVAHSAIVEFNTIKNTQHASVKFTHGDISRGQGFGNANQSIVYVRNNNYSGFGTGAYGFDSRQASFPITYYSGGNSGVDRCPVQQNAVWKACEV